jgi:tol-pal system protein YbgF
MRRIALLLLPLAFVCAPAVAQEDNAALMERLERLERDVTFVQKQVYRNGDPSAGGGAPVNAGNLQVRLSQIDEEIRQVRGLIEQVQFQNRQTATELKKLSEDTDFRLRTLEQKSIQADAAPAATPAVTPAPEPLPPVTPTTPASGEPAAYKPDSKEKPAVTGKDFPDSNAHYSSAFKLLNEKKFAEAAASFDAFVKKYPADPLTANAYYWLGESQYARNDFTRSSESFRKGFEVNPEGNKAADNLYKLAMSLSQVRRKNEACVVLNKVIEKYAETASRTAVKAEDARITMQCK